jgi:hypothetical protein
MPQALASLPGVGDGSVHRVIAQTQRQFYDPPILGPPIMWHRGVLVFAGARPARKAVPLWVGGIREPRLSHDE